MFQEYSSSNDDEGEESDNHLSNMNFDEDCFIDCDSSKYQERDNEKWVWEMKNYHKIFLSTWIWFRDSQCLI